MKVVWFLIASLFAAHLMASETPVPVSPDADRVPLSGGLQVFKDPSGALTLPQVRGQDGWQDLADSKLAFGMTSSAIWLRFSATSESSAPQPLFLHIDFPVLDEVDVYILQDGKLVNHYLAGEELPFSARPVVYYGLVFPMVARYQTVSDVYLRVKNQGSMELPVSLWKQTAFLKNQLSQMIVWGSLFSVFLVMTIYNGVLYYTTKDKVFGVFSLFCMSIFAYFFTLRGFSFQYLWPNAPKWEIVSPLVFIATSTALFNLLVYQFFQLTRMSLLGKIFLVLALLNTATIAQLLVMKFSVVMVTQIVLIIVTALITIFNGIFSWSQLHKQQRLAYLGLLSCASFAIYTTLGKLDVLGVSYFTDNGIAIAVTLMSILFSFTLADRFRCLEQEKRDVQQQSINHLGQYRSLFDSVSEGVFVLDADGHFLNANPSFCHLFNCNDFDHLKQHIAAQKSFYHSPFYTKLLQGVNERGRVNNCELELPISDETSVWVEVNAHYRKNTQHGLQIEGTVNDISERRANKTQLEYMASHDVLTNLLNRRAFEKTLKSIINREDRGHVKSALIYLDLDQFKVINDVYGHTIGDDFLKRLAVHLKSAIGGDQILARLGGDEFGVVCPETDEAQAEVVALRLLECVQSFDYYLKDSKLTVGASVGLVVFNQAFQNIGMLLSRADAACYMAKDLGRNRLHIYSSADDDLKQRHADMAWVSVIKEAIEQDKFQLYFQDIRSMSGDDDGCSYEILLRLDYQDRVVAPFDFLPAAERYGLMAQVDRWVISRFFRFLKAHPDHVGFLKKASINLSVQSISDPTFTEFLKSQFEEFSVPHKKICFEITETTAISNLETTLQFIDEYRKKGCEFAIDDFGTGFSSFAYLKQLPADYLKIDGMFVKNILTSDVDRSMVASICEVAAKLNIRTVAEFVENKSVSDELSLLGVSFGQGYYFDRPSPISDLLDGGAKLEKQG